MRLLPRFLVLAALMILAGAVTAGDYSLVRVHFDGNDGASFLAAHPELDIAISKPGVGADIVVNSTEIMDLLRGSGLRLEVVHKDLEAHYASRIQRKDTNFGGWHTYSENIAYLDSLRTEYPNLISEKWAIGQTHEMRNIWCVRLSDNPDVDESGEPEILLDTMHHAREIMSGDFGLMWADYLCSNYGTDPVVTWLMDNRELYLVSIVNPDGVVYNETIQPDGGGMWRKNRRYNSAYSYGVDPNRNFPYEWVGPGSSTDPDSETYRGPSAGSEPCVQALMNFVNSREFVTHQTLHTHGNITIHPWGYTSDLCPDFDLFQHMGAVMTRDNGYDYGYVGDLLGYPVNGVTFDWVYAGDGHAPVYTVSNEIGNSSDGFWPSFARRDALFADNIWPMTYLMMAAGAFADIELNTVTDDQGGSLDAGDTGLLSLDAVNHGLTESVVGLEIIVTCDDPYIQLLDAQRSVGGLAPMSQTAVAPELAFEVSPACPDGHLVSMDVEFNQPGGSLIRTVSFMVGTPSSIFFDDFSAGTGNWTFSGGQWGLTSTAHSAPSALTDSPSGEYGNYWNATATLDGEYYASELRFWHRYDIEEGWDYGRVQVSADGGAWATVATYTGTNNAWHEVSVDLNQYAGQALQLRFLMETDSYVTEDGWYLDDIMLLGAGSDNGLAPIPPQLGPLDGAVVGSPVMLTVANMVDPDGDDVIYGFRVYSDALQTQLVASVDDVPTGPGAQTSWYAPLGLGHYYWRAYAGDATEWGLLGDTRTFTVGDITGVDGVVIGQPRLYVLGTGGSQAELQLNLPRAADVSVKIYDARGALVRDLYSGRVESGGRSLVWDGRDTGGRQAASGVYFVRATAGADVLTGRVLMVR